MAKIVPNCLGLLGVDQVLVTGVQRLRLELGHLKESMRKDELLSLLLTYRCVTPGVGCSGITFKVLKTLWSNVSSQDLRVLFFLDLKRGLHTMKVSLK